MSHDSTLTHLERTLWKVITGFSHRAVSAEISRLAEHNLPPASWALLEHLDAEGPMRVSDIAACHGLDISSITPRLQTLERLGLVERGTAPDDRRTSLISLGAAGKTALDRIHTARREILADALTTVSKEHLAIADAVLAHLSTRLERAFPRKPEETEHPGGAVQPPR